MHPTYYHRPARINIVDYPYASGNLLEDRNHYSYTEFNGGIFLGAWKRERDSIISQLGKAKELPISSIRNVNESLEKQFFSDGKIKTRDLLKTLHSSLSNQNYFSKELIMYIDRIVKKFEVTKRIHLAYSSQLRTVDKKAYKDLDLYIYAAAVFERSYKKIGGIPYLNALLKILDTLCALQHQLDQKQKSYLAWLINQERKHIYELAVSVEVKL